MIRSSPTFPALSAPRLLFGGEAFLVAGNIAACVVMTTILKAYFWPVITIILHIVLVQLAKSDPAIRKIYSKAYSKQGDRYEPWVESDPLRGQRSVFLLRDQELL